MKYKISKSNNPTITIGKSYVQLITSITPGYQHTDIADVPYWQLYCREPRKRVTKHAVTLAAIIDTVAELDAQQHATYNAYPRGSLRRNRHYYCRVAYGRLEVYTLHDDQLAYVYSLNGDLLWLDVDDLIHHRRANYLRQRYFQRDHGELGLNLYQVDHSSRDRVARRWHDER